MKNFKSMASAVVIAAGLGLTGQAAQAADVSFMSFSYAEEAAKPSVEALLKGFEAQTKLSVEPLGYAWGDMQKNIFLRARSKTLPSVAAAFRALASELRQCRGPRRPERGLRQGQARFDLCAGRARHGADRLQADTPCR